MVKIYHYTSRESAKSIYRARVIRANPGAYGYGVYFTALPPSTSNAILILNNYDDGKAILEDPAFVNKTQIYIAFDSNSIGAKQVPGYQCGGRDVWLVNHDVRL